MAYGTAKGATRKLVGSIATSLSGTGMLAVGETVILLTSPLPQAGVSSETWRGCPQNDSLANG